MCEKKRRRWEKREFYDAHKRCSTCIWPIRKSSKFVFKKKKKKSKTKTTTGKWTERPNNCSLSVCGWFAMVYKAWALSGVAPKNRKGIFFFRFSCFFLGYVEGEKCLGDSTMKECECNRFWDPLRNNRLCVHV